MFPSSFTEYCSNAKSNIYILNNVFEYHCLIGIRKWAIINFSNVFSQAASPPPESPKSPVTIAGIEFAASAEEARKRMSGRKKEVRSSSSLSAKQKYELFQKL